MGTPYSVCPKCGGELRATLNRCRTDRYCEKCKIYFKLKQLKRKTDNTCLNCGKATSNNKFCNKKCYGAYIKKEITK